MKSSWKLHLPFALCLMFAACGGDPEPQLPVPSGGNTQQAPGSSSQALSCMPNTSRPCPCTYGGMGTQLCLATGAGYGPCDGCPPPPQTDATTGTGGLSDASQSPSPEAGGPGNTSTSGSDAGAMEPTQLPSGEGTSCGVGLPTLCALDSEKCCVRSLMTDTCIGASETCECSVSGCETLEAHCDGPEDCAEGQVCCGTLGGGPFGGSSYTEFRCADSCDYQGSQRIACHQGETECPGSNVCSNSQILTNLQVCIDPATIAQ